MPADSTWQKTPTGYAMAGHELAKVGKRWILTTATGETYDLGRKATFDHAERMLGLH